MRIEPTYSVLCTFVDIERKSLCQYHSTEIEVLLLYQHHPHGHRHKLMYNRDPGELPLGLQHIPDRGGFHPPVCHPPTHLPPRLCGAADPQAAANLQLRKGSG